MKAFTIDYNSRMIWKLEEGFGEYKESGWKGKDDIFARHIDKKPHKKRTVKEIKMMCEETSGRRLEDNW